MRPLNWYLTGNSSWFFAIGAQGVLFAWLVTMVLHESPQMVGVAQMALLLPGLALMLVGGGMADHFGGARVASVVHALAALPPLGLAAMLAMDRLSYGTMLVYAVAMGCAQAFVTPARDGLLNEVAHGRIQRTVLLASLTQFGCQILGVSLAGVAERVGGIVVLTFQSLALLTGAWAFRRIRVAPRAGHGAGMRLGRAILDGGRSVWRSAPIRMVCLQNIAMGLFFMGSFIVTMPLLIREEFSGSASDLAIVNAANAIGLAGATLLLLRFGDLTRPGRTLLLAQAGGGLILFTGALAPSLTLYLIVMFFWGIAGGFAMSMARSIVQELAPADQRGRIMSFYAFTFMGAGPLGALLNGFLVSSIGARGALMTAGSAMFLCMLVVGWAGPLWHLRHHQPGFNDN